MRQKIYFFDLLRCVAAVAVVVIHVLGPYREQLGSIANTDWSIAIGFNSVSRWAVPVFIMITGALMLSDRRDFVLSYYLKRRLGKVLIPFLVWSVFYAWLSGASLSGFDGALAWETFTALPFHETYYHLGFFYYFIPLYAVIPFFSWVAGRADRTAMIALTSLWLGLFTLFFFDVEGPWDHELVLYSGYLLLGYCLLQYQWPSRPWLVVLGGMMLLLTGYNVITVSLAAQDYTVGNWLSYKTINTALIAAMVFSVGRYYGERLQGRTQQTVAFISRYSLGIYLLHPLFLWPVRAFDLYWGSPLIMIPLWTLVCGGLALATSYLLAKYKVTAWLVP
ncbi:acyltransferase [Photobacterium swingsii]|uniref:acyltransferase n=1 Tax=Photobacterium swingsii TaxID=680026 RepID=UPI00352F072F